MIRAARLLAALVALLWIAFTMRHWGERVHSDVDGLSHPETGATLSIGLLLLGAWLFGRLFSAINLPKLSGYLVFGILVGPGLLAVVPDEQLPYLRLIETIAISLIALIAGGEIEIDYLRRSIKLVLSISAMQLLGVLFTVGAVVYGLASHLGLIDPDNPTSRLVSAAIVGTLATALSPAVFIAVMNEVRATGASVRASLSVMMAMELALIVLFLVVMALSTSALGGDASVAHVAGELAWHLLGSLVGGVVFGLVFAWYMHVVREHLAIFVIVGCIAIAMVSEAMGLESLIVAIVAGILMRNVWRERVGAFFHTMEDLSLPVYCVFFAVAGAKIDLDALASMWPAAIAIVLARAPVVWGSTHLGCRIANVEPPLRTWLWTAFISQAGVAVALVSIAQRTFADYTFADPLYALVLAVIAIHELVGPIILKFGLQRLSSAEGDGDGDGDNESGDDAPSDADVRP